MRVMTVLHELVAGAHPRAAGAALGTQLAAAHRTVEADANRLAREAVGGEHGLLAALDAVGGRALGPGVEDAVLGSLDVWLPRLRGHGRASRVFLPNGLHVRATPDGRCYLAAPPGRVGYPDRDLAELAVMVVIGGRRTNTDAAFSFVDGIFEGYGRPHPLLRFFAAQSLLRWYEQAGDVLKLSPRRLGRSVAYALAGPSGGPRGGNEPGTVLRAMLGSHDPWILLDQPVPGTTAAPTATDTITATPAAVDVRLPERLDGLVGGVTVAGGRVTGVRRHAQLTFVDVLLSGHRLQFAVPRSAVGAARPGPGDWLLVSGTVRRTGSGTPTLFVAEVLSHVRCRVDRGHIGVRAERVDLALVQAHVLAACRDHFGRAGFREVSTPLLTASFYGGRSRPYTTRRWTTKDRQHLRVTSELGLKSVLAAGLPRCYEIGPMFRNEGEDRRHLSGFLLLEAYAAYMPVRSLVDLVIPLLVEVASHGGVTVPVTRLTARDALLETCDLDIETPSGMAVAAELATATPPGGGAPASAAERAMVIYKLLETVVIPRSTGVLELTGLPIGISPLIAHDGRHHHRAWLAVNGVFVADVAQEENNVERVREALAKQFETDPYPVYRDYRAFLTTLAGGLPPCAGIGLGMSPLFKAVLGLDDMRATMLNQWCTPSESTADRRWPRTRTAGGAGMTARRHRLVD